VRWFVIGSLLSDAWVDINIISDRVIAWKTRVFEVEILLPTFVNITVQDYDF